MLNTDFLHAQNAFKSFYGHTIFSDSVSDNRIEFDNLYFVDNLEAFDKFQKGYTRLGYYVQTRLHFVLSPKVEIYGGLHLQKYFGHSGFKPAVPILGILWKAGSNLNLRIGSLPPAISVEMSDILYHQEFHYSKPSTEGLAVSYKKKSFRGSTWIQWEQYIFNDSEFPELFLFASTNRYAFQDKKNYDFSVLFEMSAFHQGGQISEYEEPVTTTANALLALEYRKKNGDSPGFSIQAAYTPAFFLSGGRKLVYPNGHGFFSQLMVRRKGLIFGAEYFYGYQWSSGRGNPIFSNISPFSNTYAQQMRSIISPYLMQKFCVAKNISAALSADVGYEFYSRTISYSVGFLVKIQLQSSFSDIRNRF